MKVLLAAGASVSAVDELGWAALHYGGNTKTIQLLLACGVDVHAVSGKAHGGRAAVHIAAAHGHCDAVASLLSAGATVNDVDAHGDTPLHHAAEHCQPRVIEMLLRAGAEVDCTSSNRSTALNRAAKHHGDGACVKVLLAAGACVNAVDKYGHVLKDKLSNCYMIIIHFIIIVS